MENQEKPDGMSELIQRITKPYETEICFVAEPGSVVRIRGRGGDDLYAIVRQITYRCGLCWQPVLESEMNKHFDGHAKVTG